MKPRLDKDGVDLNGLPFLRYDHPLALKLLRMKVSKYNRMSEKWGYEGRFFKDLKTNLVLPRKFFQPKEPAHKGFWEGFKTGYRNSYLHELEYEIMTEAGCLRYKKPLLSRYWQFILFWFNYH